MKKHTAVVATLVTAFTLALPAVQANAETGERRPARCAASTGWSCGKFENDDLATAAATKRGGSGHQVSGRYHKAKKELEVCDRFPNGHATYVYLHISGHGTARYRSYGSNTCTTHDIADYGNRPMTMQVCTSLSAKAICTKAYKYYTEDRP